MSGLSMPKLYEYFGIVVFFYSNEHEPVHVHARYQGFESKIEINIQDGKIIDYKTLKVKGKRPLPSKQLSDFEHLVNVLGDEIVQQWINYFVYHKKIIAKNLGAKL